jgi:hypothetical protein
LRRYIYQNRAGILPAAAYLGARSGGTPRSYFERAARIVLGRMAGAPNPNAFDWERDARAPEALACVISLGVNLMSYVVLFS